MPIFLLHTTLTSVITNQNSVAQTRGHLYPSFFFFLKRLILYRHTAQLQSALVSTPLSAGQATYSAKEHVLGTINSVAYNNTIKTCLIKRNLHPLFNPKQSHLLKTIQNNNSLVNYSNSSVFQTAGKESFLSSLFFSSHHHSIQVILGRSSLKHLEIQEVKHPSNLSYTPVWYNQISTLILLYKKSCNI